MSKPNHNWIQGIGFEIMTDVGVSEEKRLECEKAIVKILLTDNNRVDIHSLGYSDINFRKLVHSYEKGKDEYRKYYN